ncbi:hypothetical protein UlMin_004983 [Ulmus minor]
MLSRFFRKRKEEKTGNDLFIENGAAVLERIISNFDGDCNPIRNYSFQEIKNAKNCFHRDLLFYNGHTFNLYKGIHEDRQITVRMLREDKFVSARRSDGLVNDVAFASRLSSHNNVLKFLGCCLETEFPILVYEHPQMGNMTNLATRIQRNDLDIPLELKLRISIKVADAIAYIHHGFSKKFIHGNIHPDGVILDQNLDAKLFNFQNAQPIPEGEDFVYSNFRSVDGTQGYVAPEVLMYNRCSDKNDVYAFGALFCTILTEKTMADLFRVIDTYTSVAGICKIYIEANNIFKEENRDQVMECIKLIELCDKENPVDRPDMIQVAKALRLIASTL